MNPVSIPIDYDQWPDYRKFVKAMDLTSVPSEMLANHIYMRLWVQLGYYFQTGHYPNGCMPEPDFDFWFDTLHINFDREWLKQILLDTNILKLEGEYYFCRPFFLANENLRIAFRDRQLDLYEHKEFYHRKERFEKRAKGDAESFPIEFFADVDGTSVGPEEMNQTLCFIRMLDNVLGCRERKKDQFSLTLVHNACRRVREFGPEKLELVLKRLFKKRGTHGIPKTSEQACANFPELLLRIEPEVGWIDWARIAK